MNFSWGLIRSFLPEPEKSISVTDAAKVLTARGVEVESIVDQAAAWRGVQLGKIIEKQKHPQADRLSLCRVAIEPNAEPLSIVCGAQNMSAGDCVAVATIGTVLPGDFKIVKSKIRGVESFGMLCSASELGLAEDSEGIVILNEYEGKFPLGAAISEVLDCQDVRLELKITPNLGYVLSHWGVARELLQAASLQANTPVKPEYSQPFADRQSALTELVARSTASGLCSIDPDCSEAKAFWAAKLTNIRVQPSPQEWVKLLESVGLRSVNNVVDATNLVMLELGHPVHAYDAARVQGELRVSHARNGEAFRSITDLDLHLTEADIVIRDEVRVLALAGIMGGAHSQIQESTTSIVLEVAHFPMASVRQSSSRHKLKSDASYRFERGVDPSDCKTVMMRLLDLLSDGGALIFEADRSLPSCLQTVCAVERPSPQVSVDFSPKDALSILGVEIDDLEFARILESFWFLRDGKSWTWTIPSFRLDITTREDLAEELAKGIGYDRIPSVLPTCESFPSMAHERLDSTVAYLRSKSLKDEMVRQGFIETLQYAFGEVTHAAGEVRLQNPLSAEFAAMKTTLLPGLLRQVIEQRNRHFGSDPFSASLFEVRPVFHLKPNESQPKAVSKTESNIHQELKISWIMTGSAQCPRFSSEAQSFDFYDCRAVVDALVAVGRLRGLRVKAPGSVDEVPGFFHPTQSAEIFIGAKSAGWCGRVHPDQLDGERLHQAVFAAELDLSVLFGTAPSLGSPIGVHSLQEHPGSERDFALILNESQSAEALLQVAMKVGKPLVSGARIFDVFQNEAMTLGKEKSVAVRVYFTQKDRSPTEIEIDEVSQRILLAWSKELAANLRG